MDDKMEEPFSHLRGWIDGQIMIEVVWSYFCMFRGARLPNHLREYDPDQELGSSMGLSQ